MLLCTLQVDGPWVRTQRISERIGIRMEDIGILIICMIAI